MIDLKTIRALFFVFLVVVSPAGMVLSGIAQEIADTRLDLVVAVISPKWPDENWAFNVTFRNAGKTDVDLCLGLILQDGREYPYFIHLILSNSKGTSEELNVGPPLQRAVGNMANDIIKLGAGGEHSIRLGLEQLSGWQPFSGNSKWTGTLLPGDYRLHAEFRWLAYQARLHEAGSYYTKMNLKSDEISFKVK
jgi:hypothetical protein